VLTLEEIVQATHRLEVDRAESTSLAAPILHTLRRKLSAVVEYGHWLIENVRGRGYRLVPRHN